MFERTVLFFTCFHYPNLLQGTHLVDIFIFFFRINFSENQPENIPTHLTINFIINYLPLKIFRFFTLELFSLPIWFLFRVRILFSLYFVPVNNKSKNKNEDHNKENMRVNIQKS